MNQAELLELAEYYAQGGSILLISYKLENAGMDYAARQEFWEMANKLEMAN